jgi:hypothetical protein
MICLGEEVEMRFLGKSRRGKKTEAAALRSNFCHNFHSGRTCKVPYATNVITDSKFPKDALEVHSYS